VLGHGGDQIVWKRASYRRVRQILTNPMYAGAYAYGKTATITDARAGQPRRRIVAKPKDNWTVLLRDHHESYLSWDSYEQIQRQLSGNSSHVFGRGAVRRGPALLVSCLHESQRN
jgi:hypothetical protein